MKVKDKNLKMMVNVYASNCLNKSCYWPRSNPGVFSQGRGYSNATNEMLCGTRHAHGCPSTSDELLEAPTPTKAP